MTIEPGENPKNKPSPGILSGIVTGPDNQPLRHVHVGFVGTQLGTSTDEEGKFALEGISPGVYVLSASMVGFQDFRQEVRIRAGETIVLEVA
ncbi:MAG: carboxypeptidase-like regulatory domain-containing protein, partial [Bacteroidales bacterium]